MKNLAWGGALILLAACAAPQEVVTPPQRAITHWEGRAMKEVVAAWGEPAAQKEVDGRRTYIYPATHYSERYYPANLPKDRRTAISGPEDLQCRGVFEVDRQGVVTKAEWRGYECDFLP